MFPFRQYLRIIFIKRYKKTHSLSPAGCEIYCDRIVFRLKVHRLLCAFPVYPPVASCTTAHLIRQRDCAGFSPVFLSWENNIPRASRSCFYYKPQNAFCKEFLPRIFIFPLFIGLYLWLTHKKALHMSRLHMQGDTFL